MSNFVFVHDFSDSQVADFFQKAMEAEGFIFDGNESWAEMDGKTHYVKVANSSTNHKVKKSAWYRGYIDDSPAGSFGWFHGNKDVFSWSLWQHCKDNNLGTTKRKLTEEEIQQRELELQKKAKAKERAQAEAKLMADLISKIEAYRALPLADHPYLQAKRLDVAFASQFAKILNPKPFTIPELKEILKEIAPSQIKNYVLDKIMDYQEENLKFRNGYLFIEGYNIDYDLVFFQLIASKKNKDGINKWFPKHFPKMETFGLIGPRFDADSTSVIICEGWATAISIAKFVKFKIPVLLAWDSGNMQALAKVIRARYPTMKIWSANDNDHTKPEHENAGMLSGKDLCKSVGGYMVPPDFQSNNPADADNSDWNDMELCYGLEEASRRFINQCKNARFSPAMLSTDIPLLLEPVKPTFDEPEPPVVHRSMDTLELTELWLSTIAVSSKGIQHIPMPTEQKIEWFVNERKRVKIELASIQHEVNSSEFVPLETNIEVDEILMPLTLEVINFKENLLLQADNIIQAINRLIQLNLTQDQLIVVFSYIRNVIQLVSNDKFANNLIKQCLQKTKYFKPREKFLSSALSAIQASERVLNAHNSIAWSALVNLNEIDYWEHNRDELDKIIVDDFCQIYESISELGSCSSFDEIHRQEDKLRYLEKSLSDLTLMIYELRNEINPIIGLEKQILYILRLVQRINETEDVNIDIDRCIIANLSIILDDVLAKHQFTYIKAKHTHSRL